MTDTISEKFTNLMVSSVAQPADVQEQALAVLKAIIESLLNRKNYETAVILETHLYNKYLKLRETEEHYKNFYEAINAAYKNVRVDEVSKELCPNVKNSVTGRRFFFVVHTPFFLAHVTPLFTAIKNSDSQLREQTCIYLLSPTTEEFNRKWESIGVKVIHVFGSFMDRLLALKAISKDGNNVEIIWQCLPAGLRLATKLLDNISWWSLKMHPPIEGVKKYIGDIGIGKDFSLNSVYWNFFKAPLEFKNAQKDKYPFEKRKYKFGSFCRKELINNETHWRRVCSILDTEPLAIYYYASQEPVHTNFQFTGAYSKTIVFLGWLKEPEQIIREMSFLLDPEPYGHGLLLRESIAAGVPVLYSKKASLPPSSSPIAKIIQAEKNNFDR